MTKNIMVLCKKEGPISIVKTGLISANNSFASLDYTKCTGHIKVC